MNKEISYHSHGKVLGNYWGGGSGSYTAREFTTDSLEEIMLLNTNALRDGSLDNGMGFESLIGAIIIVTTTTKIIIDNKDFYNTEEYTHIIGNLNDDELEFLENIQYD